MTGGVQKLLEQIKDTVVGNREELEAFRLEYLSKKGKVAALFEELKNVQKEDRRAFGAELNNLKNLAQSRFDEWPKYWAGWQTHR